MKYHIDKLGKLSVFGTTKVEKALIDYLCRIGAKIEPIWDGKEDPGCEGFLIIRNDLLNQLKDEK